MRKYAIIAVTCVALLSVKAAPALAQPAEMTSSNSFSEILKIGGAVDAKTALSMLPATESVASIRDFIVENAPNGEGPQSIASRQAYLVNICGQNGGGNISNSDDIYLACVGIGQEGLVDVPFISCNTDNCEVLGDFSEQAAPNSYRAVNRSDLEVVWSPLDNSLVGKDAEVSGGNIPEWVKEPRILDPEGLKSTSKSVDLNSFKNEIERIIPENLQKFLHKSNINDVYSGVKLAALGAVDVNIYSEIIENGTSYVAAQDMFISFYELITYHQNLEKTVNLSSICSALNEFYLKSEADKCDGKVKNPTKQVGILIIPSDEAGQFNVVLEGPSVLLSEKKDSRTERISLILKIGLGFDYDLSFLFITTDRLYSPKSPNNTSWKDYQRGEETQNMQWIVRRMKAHILSRIDGEADT